MPDAAHRLLLVSDFNLSNLAGYLENDDTSPAIETVAGDFGQVYPVLTGQVSQPWEPSPAYGLVWTLPDRVSPAFNRLVQHELIDENQLVADVDAFSNAVLAAAKRLKAVFVASWTLDPTHRGLGFADLRRDRGLARALLVMNLRLAKNLDSAANCFALDSNRWLARAGRDASAPKLWFQAKIPFGNEVFQAAVSDIKSAIRGLQGQARKLIIVDLDDTLWGGIVGDAGWENLRLGGHDPVGEAHQAFQLGLKALTRRGVVLAIASKNTESVALEAIRSHPEMILKETDFAGWRINWQDKAQNIADLVEELNLGLQSVVFLDDNPAERARVREALPEVLVPEWPASPMNYLSALRGLDCFDAPAISREDGERTKSYVSERQRSSLKQQAGSLDDWLASLNLTITVEPLSAANLRRATQLLNKTNQLNLSTRRLTEPELEAWPREPGRGFWTFRVADRFGDAGLTGVASIERRGDTAHVVDFILSCRVMGRKVEEAMVAWLFAGAREIGAQELRATFLPTSKNAPMLEFWRRSGMASADGRVFSRAITDDYPMPRAVTIAASASELSRLPQAVLTLASRAPVT